MSTTNTKNKHSDKQQEAASKMKEGVIYLRDKHYQVIGAVAYQFEDNKRFTDTDGLVKKDSLKEVRYTLSLVHPNDKDNASKKTAANIARGRLGLKRKSTYVATDYDEQLGRHVRVVRKPFCDVFTFEVEDKVIKEHSITKCIMHALIEKNTSKTVKRAAKLWLSYNSHQLVNDPRVFLQSPDHNIAWAHKAMHQVAKDLKEAMRF